MAANNGHVATPNVVEDYQRQLLTANQQLTDALVTVGKGYQQAVETSVRLSFAQVKALSELFTPKAE